MRTLTWIARTARTSMFEGTWAFVLEPLGTAQPILSVRRRFSTRCNMLALAVRSRPRRDDQTIFVMAGPRGRAP